MNEKELDAFVKELQSDSVELYNFVTENTEDLSDDELDELVGDLENDTLSLREFVINALEI